MPKCKDDLPCVACKCSCKEPNTGHKCNTCEHSCHGEHGRK